jgi:hypothetical protein
MKTKHFEFVKKCLSLSFLFLIHYAIAQTPVKEWDRTFDGAANAFDEIKFIRLDAQQNVVATGRSQSGTGSTYLDVVTRKYNAAGDLLWTHTWNNSSYNFNDVPFDMEIASNGDIIIGGSSKITSSSQDNNAVVFVFALDSSGNFLWTDSIKGSGYTTSGSIYINRNQLFEIEIATDGSIYASGLLTGNDVTEYDQMFVVKYNSAGQRHWLNTYDNSTMFEYADYGTGLALDASGNAYVSGVTTLSTTWRDFAVWKIDSAGNFKWIATYPGPVNNTSEQMEEIISDDEGNTYAYGINSDWEFVLFKYDSSGVKQWDYTLDTIYPGNTSSFTGADAQLVFDNNGNLIFAANMGDKMGVAKFSPSGTLLWLQLNGGTGQYSNHAYHVLTDASNNIYVAGSYSNTGSSYFDLGAFKLDENGNLQWSVTFDGTASQNDKGHSMAVSTDGSVYVGGFTTGQTNGDYLLVKYQQSPVGIYNNDDLQNRFTIYPNPATGMVYWSFSSEVNVKKAEIFDLQGQLVYSELLPEIDMLNQGINIDMLSDGCYFMKLTTADNVFSSTVMLQRK